MIQYSINETNTKNSIREEREREERKEKKILEKYPNYYKLDLRARMAIRKEVQWNNSFMRQSETVKQFTV